jgi:hypothetical protein
MVQRRTFFGLLVVAAFAITSCAGAAPTTNERYPENKRPEAPRSASDDEVMGAHEQDPADTLDASLTNEHAAARSPHAERPAEAAHERLDIEQCLEKDLKASELPPGAERKRPVCPPLSEAGQGRD